MPTLLYYEAVRPGLRSMRLSKRLTICLIAVALIAAVFWSQSRVPALNQKAVMGDRNVIDALAFDILLVANEGAGWIEKVLISFVNWSYTNWKGMTFGLLMAAAGYVLFSILPPTKSKNRFGHALRGLLGGVPLSVCVNCATPVAMGMQQAGVRMETALGILLSSPTFNFVVVPMAIALMPPYMVGLKVALSLLVILVAIPVIVARAGRNEIPWENMAPVHGQLENASDTRVVFEAGDAVDRSWMSSLSWFADAFVKSAIAVFKLAVPFMLLAGLLGAIVVESLPADGFQNLAVTLPGVVLIAVIGVFLPVPIAFDVIICATLLKSGVPAPYVATLFITLGIYSVYPFLMIWRYISKAIAVALTIAVIITGVFGAYGTAAYMEFRQDSLLTAVNETFDRYESLPASRVISEHCDRLPLENQRLYCYEESLFQEMLNGAGSELCDAMSEDTEALCTERLTVHHATQSAIDKQDLDQCRLIDDQIGQNSCLVEAAFVLSTITLSPAPCDKLPDHDLRVACHRRVISRLARTLNEDSFCLDVPSILRPECRLSVKRIGVQLTNEIDNCYTLDGDDEIRRCRRYIANRTVAETNSKAICAELAEPLDRRECEWTLEKQDLIRTMRYEDCDRVTNPEGRGECEYAITLRDIKRIRERQRNAAAARLLSDANLHKISVASHRFEETPASLPEEIIRDDGRLRIVAQRLSAPVSSRQTFRRVEGPGLGIDHCCDYSPLYNEDPFRHTRGVTSGDFNNDGRTDLAFTMPDGVVVYKSLGDGQFAARVVNVPGISLRGAILVALIDINDDGWEDLFVTRYRQAPLFLLNEGDDFESVGVIELPQLEPPAIMAATFGDIDRDGDLDAVLGGWSYGSTRGFNPALSQNYVLRNEFPDFSIENLAGPKGETLSVLLADFNGDSWPDLIVGNDGSAPDIFYAGSESGFRMLPADGAIPSTPLNTMSVDVADINNDGLADIFAVDMSLNEPTDAKYCDAIEDPDWKNTCESRIESDLAARRGRVDACAALPAEQRDQCIVSLLRVLAFEAKDPELCKAIPDQFPIQQLYCETLASPTKQLEGFDLNAHPPQEMVNKLLLADGSGRFVDRAVDLGVGQSFWSWNAKLADLDNDGWEDIYVGNGFGVGQSFRPINTNVFFHNLHERGFERAEVKFGLDDLLNTPSYTFADIDQNGSLDIIATAVNGPTRVFVNHTDMPAIRVALRDHVGNRFGIGASIAVTLEDGTRYVRWLKSGGGYLSFDAPIAHFGLGGHDEVQKIDVRWSTGEVDSIAGPFSARQLVTIERRAAADH